MGRRKTEGSSPYAYLRAVSNLLFVGRLHPDDLNIVSTIISLAHSLKLDVIAEGVETGDQAKLLKSLKCGKMQGYLFSPAVMAEQIDQFLREKKSLAV